MKVKLVPQAYTVEVGGKFFTTVVDIIRVDDGWSGKNGWTASTSYEREHLVSWDGRFQWVDDDHGDPHVFATAQEAADAAAASYL